MKIAFLSLIALAIGIGVGVFITSREFEGERVPTKMTLAILNEKESAIGPGKGPKVVVEGGEIFDFGTMDRGSKDTHDFVFRNTGDEPLVLTMRETTCKCTALSTGGRAMQAKDQQTIPPGGSFTVSLEWRIMVTDTNFSQSAEFGTNDPRRDVVRLLIHGRTVDAIELGDGQLSFSNVSANEPAVAEMSIYSHRDQELKILKQAWVDKESKNFLEATFLPLPQEEALKRGARGGVKLRVSLKPGLPLGKTRQHLSLTPNYEGIELPPIPVEINIVGDITLLGARIRPGTTTVSLGTVEQKVGITHTVYLLVKGPHREQTEAQIAKVEPGASLQATLGEPLADSPTVKRIPIHITIPPGTLPGNYLGTDDSKTGKIVVTTNHPQVKQIDIPVLFLVQ